MEESKIIVALEIGTTKTCMVVGEVNPDGSSAVIGLGEVPSEGIRAGCIMDADLARLNLSDAWQLAQDHANVDIQSVYLSVTGEHIKGEDGHGFCYLSTEHDTITDEHVTLVNRHAGELELPAERIIVNSETGIYCIDDRDLVYAPVGMRARKLSVQSHIIHGKRKPLQDTLLCVRQVPLEVEALVFAPLATAQLVLGRREREEGALLIDIGGGTTDFICYADGNIIACGCIPHGGNSINKDIMELSPTPMTFAAAESLKCNQGNAFGDVKDTTTTHYRDDNGQVYSISRGLLNNIVRDRLADILQSVKDSVPQQVWARRGMAVYLSGGSSLMLGLDRLAQFIFRVRVYQPSQPGIGADYSYLADPRYCTAIGLIRYALQYEADNAEPEKPGLLRRILSIFRKKR